MWGHSQEVASCKPRGEALGETKPATPRASRTVRKEISVVHTHLIYGTLPWWPQQTQSRPSNPSMGSVLIQWALLTGNEISRSPFILTKPLSSSQVMWMCRCALETSSMVLENRDMWLGRRGECRGRDTLLRLLPSRDVRSWQRRKDYGAVVAFFTHLELVSVLLRLN